MAAKTVGILDLGAWLSGLPALLEALNGSQTDFQFFEVKAPIPAGLIKTKDHLVDWMESRCGLLSDHERQQVSRNMLADEFFVAAEDIRRSLHIDYIAGITAPLIAGIAGRHAYWNHLASSSGQAVVISTADLREFSQQAGRPFEVAVGVLLIAHLMCHFNSRVNIHPESRGCIFDYFGDRVGLIPVLQEPTIEDRCLNLIKPRYRGSAVAMLDALARVGGRHSSRRGQRNARATASVSSKKRNVTRG